MKTEVRNYENDIRAKVGEIEDLLLDWMEEMDLPEGTELDWEIHFQGEKYLDSIQKYMTDIRKAVDDGTYCIECGALITEYDTVWNFDHECYCKKCAARKMIPF